MNILFILLMLQLIMVPLCIAEMIDRVIAYVDDNAITYSEFREKFASMRDVVPGISEEDVVNSMINTLLLLDQARKMRLEAVSHDDLVKEYVDIKIKSRIFIKEEQITEYYKSHRNEFRNKDYLSVREEIEKYLTELEINRKLKEHLEDLRKGSNIVVRLRDK
jgi:PHD/YefM family antitoxin component YafN of YafNO toxin-antitoxin module